MNISESHLDVLIISTIFLRSNDSFVGKNRFPSSLFLLLSVYHFCFLDCYCYYGRRADNTPRRLYKNVILYSLGIDKNINQGQLNAIASSKNNVFTAASFSDLKAQTIVQNSCPGRANSSQ